MSGISHILRYCGYCGRAFNEGDKLSVIIAQDPTEADPEVIDRAYITVHRACSEEIKELDREEQLRVE